MQLQKKFWVIILSIIIFFSGSLLGISTVYKVERVTLESSLVSEEARAEAQLLQEKLEQAYEKEMIFFVNSNNAEEVMREFPYFRLTAFEKSYPNRLIIKIAEGAEVYAVETEGVGYYILGEDGTILGVRDTHINILNGAENVVIKGLGVRGENGSLPVGDAHFTSVLELCKELSARFGGIRSNVVSVEVFMREPETIYRVTMREGVKLYFGNPIENIEGKVKAAVDAYVTLTNEEKLSGRIIISGIGEDIFTSYHERDEFAS